MDYNKKRFGELVNEAVGQIALKRGGGTKFAATEAELADVLHCSISMVQKYRQGASMPANPEQTAEVMVKHCIKHWRLDRQWAESLLTQVHHPDRRTLLATLFPEFTSQAKIVICYQGNGNPDKRLATYLYNELMSAGHDVFPDNGNHTSPEWFAKINQLIRRSDLFVVLLSKETTHSEMTVALTQQAYEYGQLQRQPRILPVFVAYDDAAPHPLNALLDEQTYSSWSDDEDNHTVYLDILAACEGNLPTREPRPLKLTDEVSEDGDFITTYDSVTQPRPQVNPRFLETDLTHLAIPGGTVKLRDQLYIERDADTHLKREVIKIGTTITIRAPRQTGKSSLLVRGLQHARQTGFRVINIDLQSIERQYLTSMNEFLRALAGIIALKLHLDQSEVDRMWGGSLGPQMKLTNLFEDYILPESDLPIVLALDEADRLLRTDFYQDFFSLLRSWHNERASNELWDRLNIILAISTEPYLLIPDISQSPFNVGLKLYLKDFSLKQVERLNARHNSPVSVDEIPQLMKLLNGHPYLTRKIFYVLVTQSTTLLDLLPQVNDELGPFGDHLRHHYWLLQNEEALKASLKQVITQNRCDDEVAFFRLLRAGLVKGTNDACACRCELYQTYFKGKL